MINCGTYRQTLPGATSQAKRIMSLQEKTWPIETFFHKIVMVRNRLRTMEQQINASDLPSDAKLKLQSYLTACYGSLTSFNVLFADPDDRFRNSLLAALEFAR